MYLWILGITLATFLLVLLLICAKINVKYIFHDQKHQLFLKFGIIKINLSKFLVKKKSTDNKKQEKVEKLKKNKEKSKLTFDKVQIFIELIPEFLEILDQLAFSLTIKKIILNCEIATEDNAKTGNIIAGFWVMYGNILTFLQKNFIIDFIDINASPIWDKFEFNLKIKSEIEIETRIIKILKNINFKDIKQMRKRVEDAQFECS